jgi:hypothetical protein
VSTRAVSDRISRFPFPFPQTQYRYSTNVEPARVPVRTVAGGWGRWVIDADEEYTPELDLRAEILARDPGRHVVLDHMAPAAWDTLVLCLSELAAANPVEMVLRREGERYVWSNARLGEERRFRFGDPDSLGAEPLGYVGSQVQEDLVLLDQREGQLWGDGGLVTFAADWSLRFDLGMSFLQIHGPVPRVHAEGTIPRAHQFLLRLGADTPYRRTNWTLSIGRRLDQSTEIYPEWGPDRAVAAADPALAPQMHLRTEVQHLIRLPTSGAILFLIRTYLLSLPELATVPEWSRRFADVLEELPEDMAEYKGVVSYRASAIDWLREHAEG